MNGIYPGGAKPFRTGSPCGNFQGVLGEDEGGEEKRSKSGFFFLFLFLKF